MTSSVSATGAVVVNARGPARASDLAYARRRVGSVHRFAPARVRAVTIDLVVDADSFGERGASVKAELDLEGTIVCERAEAATVPEAVDLLETRLRQRIECLPEAARSTQRDT